MVVVTFSALDSSSGQIITRRTTGVRGKGSGSYSQHGGRRGYCKGEQAWGDSFPRDLGSCHILPKLASRRLSFSVWEMGL